MIVQRIEVEAFKCFLEPRAVDLDPTRINVVAAPNGSGKSTLLEALRFAFLYSHKSADSAVQAILPWGRSVAPRVAVDFEAGGRRYRIEKRYLQGATARLNQWVDGRYELLSEGPKAEEEVRQFAGMKPGFDKGARSKDEFWTSVLWTPQGGMALAQVDGTVVEQVRASLGSQLETGIARKILNEAESVAAVNWPEKKNQYSKNSPVRALEERRAELDARVRDLAAELESMAQLRDAIAQLDDGLTQAETSMQARRGRLDALRGDLERWKDLSHQAQLERGELDKARAAEQSLFDAAKRRKETQQRLAELDEQASEVAALLQSLRARQGDATLDTLRRGRDLLTAKSRAARAYLEAARDAALLEPRIHRAQAAEARIGEIEAALAALHAPSRAQLDQLKDMERKRELLESQLQGALVHLELRPDVALNVEVLEGEPAGPQRVEAPLTVSGSPRVRIRVEGVGEWTASGPASSADEIRARLRDVTQQFTAALAAAQAPSVEVLEERCAKADSLHAAWKDQRVELSSALAGETVDALARRLQESQDARRQAEAAHPEWKAQPPSVAAIDADLESVDARIAEAERLQSEIGDAAATDRSLASQLEEKRAELEKMMPEAALQEQLDGASMTRRGHELQLKALEAQCAAFPPQLAETGAALEREIEQLEHRLLLMRQERASKQGALEEKSAKSHYGSLIEAEEKVSDLSVRLEREKARADAALLLRNTLRACRQDALENCAGEVAAGATRLLGEITPVRLGSVQLDPHLAPAGLVPTPVNDGVPLELLSGGESEQVHFATRLALADLLCRHEPQLVVFDDVLLATDSTRIQRILAMLEERSERMQVLLLTCHPERYEALRASNLVEL